MEELTVEGLTQPAAQPGGPEQSDIAVRVRAWFNEAWHHKLWVDYRREAEEDEGFYVGGDLQWSVDGSLDELTRLKALKRAHVSVNNIQPIVDALSGYERQNRFDIKAAPQGEEDAEEARKMTWLLKFVQEQADAHNKSSEVFEGGTIRGMKALEVALDFDDDPVNGDIELVELEPGQDVIWDPWWTELATLRDARYVLKFKHVFEDDLLAQYPDEKDAITAALSGLAASRDPSKLTQGDPRDGYGGVNTRSQEYETARLYYDQVERKVMVVEAWYRDYEDKWFVSDKRTGRVHDADSKAVAQEAAQEDPDHLTAIRRRRKVIRMAVVLPATFQVLEEGNPYENDEQDYPFAVFVAKRKGDRVYGIVRNLKDPQRMENKRESQAQDLLGRFANIRPMAEQAALENPEQLRDPWSQEPVWLKAGHQAPSWYVPPLGEVYKILASMADRNQLSMRHSSGINTDLLGLRDKGDPSGIAIARTQAQGQIIATVFFDNYRRFRQALGQRLARRIQQSFTLEKTLRLTNEKGQEVFVTLNPAEARDLQGEEFARFREERDKLGRPVLRNLSTLKYDIVISEAPSTPTMRSTALLALLEVLKVLPGLAPAMMDLIVELAEIPERAKVLERVRKMFPQLAEDGGAVPDNLRQALLAILDLVRGIPGVPPEKVDAVALRLAPPEEPPTAGMSVKPPRGQPPPGRGPLAPTQGGPGAPVALPGPA